jgi:hypothetical protein
MHSTTSKFVIVSLVYCLAACSADVDSKGVSSNHGDPSVTPLTTQTPYALGARFMNQAGWPIPMPENKEQVRVTETTASTESGEKVAIEITDYAPLGEFAYASELSAYPHLEARARDGLLLLQLISQLKYNNKIYGYSVFSAPGTKDVKTGMVKRNGHMFVYRLFDSDGDGRFETMITDSSPFKIPAWTLK